MEPRTTVVVAQPVVPQYGQPSKEDVELWKKTDDMQKPQVDLTKHDRPSSKHGQPSLSWPVVQTASLCSNGSYFSESHFQVVTEMRKW